MKLLPSALAVLLLVLPAQAASPGRSMRGAAQMHVESLAAAEPLRSGLVGVLAVTMSGDTLVSYNPSSRMVPASNMKLLTTGVALNVLGEDFRFPTVLAYSGSVRDSTLFGDLYIVGGSDPTIGSRSDCALAVHTLFARWKKILSEGGIRRIQGRIIGDSRSMLPEIPLSWTLEDVGSYYGAVPEALNFFENAQNFSVTPGATVGSEVKMEPDYPQTPWMRYVSTCTTSPARCGDEMVYLNTALAPVGQLSGHYSVDRRRKTLECSNRFGAYTCAYHFRKYLTESGMRVDGGWADISPEGLVRENLENPSGLDEAPEQGSLNELGKSLSPSLADIVFDTNHFSDNFFAETLLHAVGTALEGSPAYDSCYVAMKTAFRNLGLRSSGGCQLKDGSGLSRKNYVSPEFFVSFLKAMAGTPQWETYLNSLPVPAERGTLEFRMKSSPESVRSRIHMKSGSMNGVRCFSGYILSADADPSRTIVFSLMTNNVTAGSWSVYPVLDDMIACLAAENN